jgi:hypothetical protein
LHNNNDNIIFQERKIMNHKKPFVMLLFLILAMLACNLPGAQENSDPANVNNSAAATITALAATIQAQGQSTSVPAASSTPENTAKPTDTPTITLTPTDTLTPTPSVPMVTVSQTTNCRTGPGTMYDLVSALNPGGSAQVVGKFSAGNYWVINTPGSAGTCWLWGQYATVSGNTSGLPEMYAPPSPTPALPATPKHFVSSVSCTKGALLLYNVHVDLSWTDVASNEDGYYIFRNGKLLSTLAANSTDFADDTTLPMLFKIGNPPPSISYSVQAFNSAGTSDGHELSVKCP